MNLLIVFEMVTLKIRYMVNPQTNFGASKLQ